MRAIQPAVFGQRPLELPVGELQARALAVGIAECAIDGEVAILGARLDGSGTLYKIFIDPFQQMVSAPDLLVQTVWEGLVSGVLYALIALGFVLIFKASGVFNFAQGAMVLAAALALVRALELFEQWKWPFWLAVVAAFAFAAAVMALVAWAAERLVLRKLVNQEGIILFMATIGVTFFIFVIFMLFRPTGLFAAGR